MGGREVRVLEEIPGSGTTVTPGDRIRVELTGHYATGEPWGHGPLTFIAGDATYPDTHYPLRVGSVIRMQYVVNPNDTSVRLVSFHGGDWQNRASDPTSKPHTSSSRQSLGVRRPTRRGTPGPVGYTSRPAKADPRSSAG